MNATKVFKSYYFWIIFIMISTASIFIAWLLFPQSFPLVSIDLTMNRTQALEQAAELSKQNKWLTQPYRQTATFDTDTDVKTYIELEAGGVSAFENMMKEQLYIPYTWHVRHFIPGETHETMILFTPSGQPYAFTQTLSENDPGPELTAAQAQKIAEEHASQQWKINLDEYTLLETNKDVTPSKRADYTFVYEKIGKKIGQAFFRLKLTVSGDKFTQLLPYVKIPESFTKHYQEIRSANNNIAFLATVAMFILYLFGGCIIGLFFMLRKNYIIWIQPFIWGAFIALLHFLTQLNQLPQLWISYNTALSERLFLVQVILSYFKTFLYESIFYGLVITAAETFTRYAFGNHLLFWKLWTKRLGSSKAVLGRTVTGYLIVPVILAYVTILYMMAQRYFGWWLPSDALIDPNVLSTYVPWLSAIATSLKAGFTEECLFRAIPLAGAAIIGRRFGQKKLCIFLGFIIQILIFGAAHANYATQPAYARVIELIVPSTVFGVLYLFFGLLPAIVSHVVFDIFWFSLPLFVSTASKAWINQMFVLIMTLIPLLVVFIRKTQAGKWTETEPADYNKEWHAKTHIHLETEPKEQTKIYFKKKLFIPVLGSLCGALMIFWLIKQKEDAIPLTITRSHAIEIARNSLNDQGITFSDQWKAVAALQSSFEENNISLLRHTYIWQLSKELYRSLMGTYLLPAGWLVRFIRATGTISQRTEEYKVSIMGNGAISWTDHIVSEDYPGKQLTQEQARTLALQAIEKQLNKQKESLKEITAQETKQPNRSDWLFTFIDTDIASLQKDEARINVEIVGDEIVSVYRSINVPEQWQREKTSESSIISIIQFFSSLIIYIILFFGLAFAMMQLGKHRFSLLTSLKLYVFFIVFFIVLLLNRYPQIIANFNTIEPWMHQLFSTFSSYIIYIIFYCGILSICITLIATTKSHYTSSKSWYVALYAMIAGLVIRTVISYINWILPSTKPVWASYSSMAGYLPISYIANILITWLMLTILLTLLSFIYEFVRTNIHVPKTVLFITMVISILLLFGTMFLDSIKQWLIIGTIIGILYWFAYEYLLRFDYTLICLGTASYMSLLIIQQLFFNPYGSSLITCLIGIVLLYVLSFIWFKRVNRAH